MKTGSELIAEERERQKTMWTANNDDHYIADELAIFASYYALPEESRFLNKVGMPFPKYWNPTPNNRVRELKIAGALIAAEIDRLHRLQEEDERKNRDSNKT